RARRRVVAGPPALRRADGPSRQRHAVAGAPPPRRTSRRAPLRARRRDPRPRGRRPVRANPRASQRPNRGGPVTVTCVRLTALGLARAPLRTLLRALVLAGAVALLGSMLVFLGHSLSTMTSSAVRSVPLDWQGPVGSYGAARRVAADASHVRGVLAAS